MKHGFIFLFFLFVSFAFSQTIAVNEKFNLPSGISETSGLIFFNNRLVTHNDSGGTAQLFELDTISGVINRTVTINNATNVDWEDLAHDNNYIYIGDIGNNSGDRTDLKVYRVSKTDYENNTTVNADVINYSYADQADFTPSSNNTDWDAEGLIALGNYLYIFSKNWVNNEVDLYVIPNTPGNHIANKEGTYDVQGLVTGADLTTDNSKIYLTGYSESSVTPFIFMLYDISISPPTDFDLFSNSNNFKFDAVLPFGNQVEGISFVEQNGSVDHLFISNEALTIVPLNFDPKLRSIDVDNTTLSTLDLEKTLIKVYPNPFSNVINISELVDEVKIYDNIGRLVKLYKNTNNIQTFELQNGLYIVHVLVEGQTAVFKLIK